MLELLLCSSLTILPDYLVRRYLQGKRIGREITIFSVWYELRWGITLCLILTVSLITMIFYFHPATPSAVAFFRTVPILSEGVGRVSEVYVTTGQRLRAGDRIFKLDSREQEAAAETARRKIAEIDAAMTVAKTDIVAAEGRITEAQSALQQAQDELAMKSELMTRNASTVSQREIERLQNVVTGREGSVAAAMSARDAVEAQLSDLLPSQKASAEAALAEAEVELHKTTVYAGVDGTVEQFTLRVGDIVNPLMRPAGILVPSEAGKLALQAGFGQIEAQVMKVGMTAEVACIAKPWTIIPMVVTQVQNSIAAGQVRPTDQLLDPMSVTKPGSILVYLEPLYEGGLDGVPPGSSCVANAYTSNYDRLDDPDVGGAERFYLHVVDTVGLVHAMLLRIQAIMLPVRTLVLGGGH